MSEPTVFFQHVLSANAADGGQTVRVLATDREEKPVAIDIEHAAVRDAIESLINGAELALAARATTDAYVPNIFMVQRASIGPSLSADHVGLIAVLPGGGDLALHVRRSDARELGERLIQWAARPQSDLAPGPVRPQ